MNLLTDAWIPIQQQGRYQKITLQQLLCSEETVELCLPRDDMELACLQLLCAVTQVLITPKNKKELGGYVMNPLSENIYHEACQGKEEWFDLDHPETPFMQFRGVRASKTEPYTGMEKLLAGVADGANKAFVNQQGLGSGLCGSCTAIALFNMANNAPSVGGGFQGSFRGNTPITIIIQGKTLRETVWFNVLTEQTLNRVMPWYQDTKSQKPNFVEKDEAGKKLNVTEIGLVRGLLWQPAHYELYTSNEVSVCNCCGVSEPVYRHFKKEKFKYVIEGCWPHPLSSRSFVIKKGNKEEKFLSLTTNAPYWTHMERLLVDEQTKKGGQTIAPVIQQAREFLSSNRVQIIIGGYRYKPPQTATIIERRHELFSLAQGWAEHGEVIRQIISTGLDYKNALWKSLNLFAKGIKDKVKGSGINLCNLAEADYYQQTENLLHQCLATIDFATPENDMELLSSQLRESVTNIFDKVTESYRQEPKMLKALALARRSLHKSLKELKPQGVAHD